MIVQYNGDGPCGAVVAYSPEEIMENNIVVCLFDTTGVMGNPGLKQGTG